MKANTPLLVIATVLASAAPIRAAQPTSQPAATEPNAAFFSALTAIESVQVAALRCDFGARTRTAPWLAVERSVERHLRDANVPLIPAVYVGRRIILPDKPVYLVNACLLSSQDSRSYICHLHSSLSITVAHPEYPDRTFKADVWQSEPEMLYVTADKLVSTVTNAALKQADSFTAACKRAHSAAPATVAQQPQMSARPAEPITAAEAAKAYAFVASKNSSVYHRPTCSSVKRISVGNLVGYATREQAEAAGKRPCKRCQP